jgi:phospholipase/carboxylesterase
LARQLDTVDVQTGPAPVGSIIWMHGLGADAHDFEPIVPELARPLGRPLRFVFPNAPLRPVSINAGYTMRAWFDIVALGGASLMADEAGIRASAASIRELIRRENDHGIPTSRIVLGGFSQGAAMAVFAGVRHPGKLAGIAALSGFAILPEKFDAERTAASEATPVFLGHGKNDPMVPLQRGEEARQLLESRGYPVEWHTYPLEHSVSMDEIKDLADWLNARIG